MKEILFVCTGNLCRSPMAEVYLRFLIENAGREDWKIFSAGTHAVNGTCSPAEACTVSKEYGVDLSEHRAQLIERADVERAELICVMDRFHRNIVLLLSPMTKAKMHFLGHWAQGRAKEREIPDPMGQSLRYYKDSFRLIKECVDRLFEEEIQRESLRVVK